MGILTLREEENDHLPHACDKIGSFELKKMKMSDPYSSALDLSGTKDMQLYEASHYEEGSSMETSYLCRCSDWERS